MIPNTYPKSEKLKSKKSIELLFTSGKKIYKFPFALIFIHENHTDSLVKFGVSVSKRNFKKAVERNRIKRLMRECYRLNKNLLFPKITFPISIMIIYSHKEIMTFKEMEKRYKMLIDSVDFSVDISDTTHEIRSKL